MAKLGFGILMVMQNEWTKAAEDIATYREIAHRSRPRAAAADHPDQCLLRRKPRRRRRSARSSISARNGSRSTTTTISPTATSRPSKATRATARWRSTYAKINESAETKAKATDFYVSIQIVGTPKDCLEKIAELQRCTGMDHLVTEFSFGGMPHEEGEVNMRLFADKVMPILQRDPAFAAPPAPALTPKDTAAPDVFAPA